MKRIEYLKNIMIKNSPTILTGLGVAGLISTTVMAVRVTPKALNMLSELQDHATNFEKIQIVWKLYIPTTIMGSLTIACIIGANSINSRRNTALASIYAISKTALEEYQSKVVETIGKNKDRKIKDEIAKEIILNNPPIDSEIILTKRGETLCYDNLSGRYFKSDIETIKKACNKLSRQLMTDMFITINQLYSELELKGTKIGDMLGWNIEDGIVEPDFSSQLTEDGTPCLVLDFITQPRYWDLD